MTTGPGSTIVWSTSGSAAAALARHHPISSGPSSSPYYQPQISTLEAKNHHYYPFPIKPSFRGNHITRRPLFAIGHSDVAATCELRLTHTHPGANVDGNPCHHPAR